MSITAVRDRLYGRRAVGNAWGFVRLALVTGGLFNASELPGLADEFVARFGVESRSGPDVDADLRRRFTRFAKERAKARGTFQTSHDFERRQQRDAVAMVRRNARKLLALVRAQERRMGLRPKGRAGRSSPPSPEARRRRYEKLKQNIEKLRAVWREQAKKRYWKCPEKERARIRGRGPSPSRLSRSKESRHAEYVRQMAKDPERVRARVRAAGRRYWERNKDRIRAVQRERARERYARKKAQAS